MQSFSYKGRVYRAVGLESITRWSAKCITCNEPFTFTAPGEYVSPRWPIRRCRPCRAVRKKRLTERRRARRDLASERRAK